MWSEDGNLLCKGTGYDIAKIPGAAASYPEMHEL